ncbi:MAG TPA: hypothetical protein VMV81_03195 [Phycisphaerae bacterium]|nr:hypothetical protein [Phycisphaerae bacterium]
MSSNASDRAERVQPERISFRGIYIFCAALALLLIALEPVAQGVLSVYRRGRPLQQVSPPMIIPDSTRDWIRSPSDLEATRRREEENLHSIAWIDRDKGVVRIPIEQAMKLIAARPQLTSRPGDQAHE